MKIKCVKIECSVCHRVGLAQVFLNKRNEARYARVRHYSHINKDSHKPQFTYCKIQDLEPLKTLLCQRGISLSTEKLTAGQVGHGDGFATLDPQLRGCATIQQNKSWASGSVRIEHQP